MSALVLWCLQETQKGDCIHESTETPPVVCIYFQPGIQYRYSNVGYMLLAMVIIGSPENTPQRPCVKALSNLSLYDLDFLSGLGGRRRRIGLIIPCLKPISHDSNHPADQS